ncbi:MAG: hypothetical protein ABI779_16490 [Acidobacteriota bacterium]
MTSAERGQVLLTGRLLEAAAKLDLLSTGITLLAAASLFFSPRDRVVGILCVVLGIVVKFYAVRIAFDARLLADIAAGTLTTADLDAAFPKKAGRDWSLRCAGAKRLVLVFGVLVIVQCVLVVLS